MNMKKTIYYQEYEGKKRLFFPASIINEMLNIKRNSEKDSKIYVLPLDKLIKIKRPFIIGEDIK